MAVLSGREVSDEMCTIHHNVAQQHTWILPWSERRCDRGAQEVRRFFQMQNSLQQWDLLFPLVNCRTYT